MIDIINHQPLLYGLVISSFCSLKARRKSVAQRKRRERRLKNVLTLLWLLAPAVVGAAQWTNPFLPTGVYVSSEANQHLRVLGVPSGCLANWAYINQADSGSKTYIASLLLAYASGKQVNLYVSLDANGYCHIIEAQVGG